MSNYKQKARTKDITFFTELVRPVHGIVNVDHIHTIVHTHQSFKNANLPVASHCSAFSCNRRANDAGPP